MKNSHIDNHTLNAAVVADYTYFKVAEQSFNENPGLLVGTIVKKYSEPQSKPSRQWNGEYFTVQVTCPNGEIRKICCDSLIAIPVNGKTFFEKQQAVFDQI